MYHAERGSMVSLRIWYIQDFQACWRERHPDSAKR